jgi:GNAT superfamily N-acetyltransferase
MSLSLRPLDKHCFAQPDPISEYGYILTFCFDLARVTIRVIFNDENSGADLAVTNMVTLPESERGKGCGSHALQSLLTWAKDHHLRHFRAVQVQNKSEPFWLQNGFVRTNNKTNDFVLWYE